MTEPSNFIKVTVEGPFECKSSPTSTGPTPLAADVGLLDDTEAELVSDGEPQALTSSRKPNAEANRNVNMMSSPGELCRSSRSFELAVVSLNGNRSERLLSLPVAIFVPRA